MVVNRPDLRQTELGIDRAAAETRLARAEAWADWTLGTHYENERTVDEPTGLKIGRVSGIQDFDPDRALESKSRPRLRAQGSERAGAPAIRSATAFDSLGDCDGAGARPEVARGGR